MHDTGGTTSSSDTSSHTSSSHTSDTSWHTSHTPHLSSGSDGMPPGQYYYQLDPSSYGSSRSSRGAGSSVALIVFLVVSVLLPIVLALHAILSS